MIRIKQIHHEVGKKSRAPKKESNESRGLRPTHRRSQLGSHTSTSSSFSSTSGPKVYLLLQVCATKLLGPLSAIGPQGPQKGVHWSSENACSPAYHGNQANEVFIGPCRMDHHVFEGLKVRVLQHVLKVKPRVSQWKSWNRCRCLLMRRRRCFLFLRG